MSRGRPRSTGCRPDGSALAVAFIEKLSLPFNIGLSADALGETLGGATQRVATSNAADSDPRSAATRGAALAFRAASTGSAAG